MTLTCDNKKCVFYHKDMLSSNRESFIIEEMTNDDEQIYSCKWCGGVVTSENEHDIIRYSMNDVREIIQQIKYIEYPPSGKLYVFKDGENHIMDCEDWNLEPMIKRKLVEIDHIKKGKDL